MLGQLAEAVAILPSALILSGIEDADLDDAVAGDNSDVYRAFHYGEPVVLKHYRAFKRTHPNSSVKVIFGFHFLRHR